jgi:predicted ribosome quality control (RQC) complex YloA/Tae2 family protein
MRPLARLIDARIRRIDAPHDELLSLVFAGREERGVLLFCWAPSALGAGIVSERPHGRAASSFVQKLRKELEGGRLVALLQPSDSTLELDIRRGDSQRKLLCHFAAQQIALFDEHDVLLASQAIDAPRSARVQVTWPETLEELEARGPALLAERASSSIEQRRVLLDKLVRNAVKRLERRLVALAEDVQRAESAQPLRARANLLVANLHAVKRGATSVSLLDYTQDPPATIALELDSARTPKEHVEAWFKQARRFERGAQLALQRTAATERELTAFAELRAELSQADEPTLERLALRARELGVRGLSGGAASPRKTPQQARHKPYRELRGHGRRAILVGKGAEDNDTLTREHARPQDLWLHARDTPGAHVVVPLERNETCPEELLLDAAHLAAHFSDARDEPNVDVSYTHKRHVHKPRKAPAGSVQLTQHKVLRLQMDHARLQQLLASELRD